MLGDTVSVYVAPVPAGLTLVLKTTRSILVSAGIVTMNVVTTGGEPLLTPGSPRYSEARPISPATKGARYAATCVLLVAVPTALTVNVTVTHLGALLLFLILWVL